MLIDAGPAKTVQTWQNTTIYLETTFIGADCFQLSLTIPKSAVMMALASSYVGTLELIITGRWSFRWPYSLVVFLLSIRLCTFSSGSIVELDAVWISGCLAPVTKHSPCSHYYIFLYNTIGYLCSFCICHNPWPSYGDLLWHTMQCFIGKHPTTTTTTILWPFVRY